LEADRFVAVGRLVSVFALAFAFGFAGSGFVFEVVLAFEADASAADFVAFAFGRAFVP
jgi:hypothetical protein